MEWHCVAIIYVLADVHELGCLETRENPSGNLPRQRECRLLRCRVVGTSQLSIFCVRPAATGNLPTFHSAPTAGISTRSVFRTCYRRLSAEGRLEERRLRALRRSFAHRCNGG